MQIDEVEALINRNYVYIMSVEWRLGSGRNGTDCDLTVDHLYNAEGAEHR